MMDKKIIKDNFSRAAKDYDLHSKMHQDIIAELLFRLPKISLTTILEVGCGTGLLTKRLIESFPEAKIIATDIAQGMVEFAKKTLAPSPPNIEFIEAEGEGLPFEDNTFDLVISSSALQWMDCRKALAEFKRVLKPGGTLAFSTYGPKTLIELKELGFSVNDFPTIEALEKELPKNTKLEAEIHKIEFKNPLDLLKYLKAIGASYSQNKKKDLEGKKKMERLKEAYPNGIEATFEAVFGIINPKP